MFIEVDAFEVIFVRSRMFSLLNKRIIFSDLGDAVVSNEKNSELASVVTNSLLRRLKKHRKINGPPLNLESAVAQEEPIGNLIFVLQKIAWKNRSLACSPEALVLIESICQETVGPSKTLDSIFEINEPRAIELAISMCESLLAFHMRTAFSYSTTRPSKIASELWNGLKGLLRALDSALEALPKTIMDPEAIYIASQLLYRLVFDIRLERRTGGRANHGNLLRVSVLSIKMWIKVGHLFDYFSNQSRTYGCSPF